jgi:FKBP-type peptidyl-prolyl cis-trans isomerase
MAESRGMISGPADKSLTDLLKIEDEKEGEGPAVKPGDVVSVHYTGRLTDGKKFDSSLDSGRPIVVPVGFGKVIRGWDLGLVGMKAGGKRKLTIPPELGYGSNGTPDGTIPPNATLVFDIELVQIEPSAKSR